MTQEIEFSVAFMAILQTTTEIMSMGHINLFPVCTLGQISGKLSREFFRELVESPPSSPSIHSPAAEEMNGGKETIITRRSEGRCPTPSSAPLPSLSLSFSLSLSDHSSALCDDFRLESPPPPRRRRRRMVAQVPRCLAGSSLVQVHPPARNAVICCSQSRSNPQLQLICRTESLSPGRP